MTPALAEHRLLRAGLALPAGPPPPAGAYRSAGTHGTVTCTSGQVPLAGGVLTASGTVGGDVSVEQARLSARQAALNALAAVRSEIGSLDDVVALRTLRVYIATAPMFTDHVAVADGASEVLAAAFPDLPLPVRTAIGVSSLPLGALVEVELAVVRGDVERSCCDQQDRYGTTAGRSNPARPCA